jgi:hypothetical protein
MHVTRLTLGLALCMLLDFSCPFVGGAFTFSADDCIDGVRLERQALSPAASDVVQPAGGARVRIQRPQVRHVTSPVISSGWLAEVRRASTTAPAAPPAPGDDH